MKGKVTGEITGEFLDSVDGYLRRIIKVIHHDDFVTAKKKLEDCMAADVTGSTGNQNGFV